MWSDKDIFETRRQRLKALIAKKTGSSARFADAYGYTRAQISQYLSATYNGGRSIGERVARNLEEVAQVPQGWLDWPVDPEDSKLVARFNYADGDEIPAGLTPGSTPWGDLIPNLYPRVQVEAKLIDTEGGLEIEKEAGPMLPMIKSSENQYAIRIVTHKLSPRVRSEEFIVVDSSETPANGDDVLIGTSDGDVIAATFLYERGNAIFVASFDTGTPTPIAKDSILTFVPVVSIFTKHLA